jgi:hypothetical protein
VPAARLWARAEWRRRPATFVMLTVAVGLALGVVLATAAGAIRTRTAYERLVEATDRYDLQIQDDAAGSPLLDVLADLEGVAAADRIRVGWGFVDGGRQLLLVGGRDGRFGAEFDRPLVLEGRLPTGDNEVLLNEEAIESTGLGVGDRLTVATITPEQLDRALELGDPGGPPAGPVLDLQIVGRGRVADDLDRPDAAGILSSKVINATAGQMGAFDNIVRLRLDGGAAAAAAFQRQIEGRPEHDPGLVYVDHAIDDGKRVIDGLVVQSGGLLLFALAALLATFVSAGQAIARQLDLVRNDMSTLASIGADASNRAKALTMTFLPVVLGATVVAVAVSVVVSPVFPTGLAKRAEPDPGLRVEPAVVAVVTPVIVVLAAGGLAWLARRKARPNRPAVGRRTGTGLVSSLVRRVARFPALAAGVQLALDAGSGDRRTAARSTLVGIVGAVAAAAAALSFASSLDRLVTTPQLYGWAWDVTIGGGGDADATAALADDLAERDDTAAVAIARIRGVEIAGKEGEAFALDLVRGAISPVVLEGRLPQTAEEIALGPAMLDAVGTDIGSLITLAGDRGDDVNLKVVGTVVLPAGEDTAGVSSVVTRDGLERLRRSDGYSDVFVRFAEGADPEAALAELPEGRDVFFAEQPTSVKNLVPVRSTPRALALFLAVLALAAAGHGLATAVRRRRRDLAVLRALGFRRNQISTIVASQATVVAVVGVAVGIPAGAVVGRLVWTEFALGARVVPAPATPVAVFAACLAGAIVLVNVLAIGPAWYARRAAVAAALNAE